MLNRSFDFQNFIETRKNPTAKRSSVGSFGEYAYAGDVRVLRSLSYAKPVRIAVDASVRAFKAWEKASILGSAVRIGPRQFPSLHGLVAECAQELHIPVPTTYITQNNAFINAHTFGTETDSFIVLNSLAVDRLTPDELRFVIGHECGHIQNSHVSYSTALYFLTHMTGIFVKGILTPARLALLSWSRAAEITCDRAGMLCCRDKDVAIRALVKVAGGSQALLREFDVEAYLAQLKDIKEGIGRVSEFLGTHPYLPKRVKAIELFAESEYFRHHLHQQGGTALSDVDTQVAEVVSVL